MVRTKKIRGKTYKHGGRYANRQTALSRARAMRSKNNNATVLKENDGTYVVWVRSKESYY